MSTPTPEPSGPPLRAIAMVLIAAAIVFLGLGWYSLSQPDDGGEPAGQAGVITPASAGTNGPDASAPPVAGTATSPVTASPATASPATNNAVTPPVSQAAIIVRVYNNSNVQGLAAKTAEKLRASGWTVAEVTNYSDGVIPTTTAYYGTAAGERVAAEQVAAELGVKAEPRFAGIKNSSPGVIVIVAEQ